VRTGWPIHGSNQFARPVFAAKRQLPLEFRPFRQGLLVSFAVLYFSEGRRKKGGQSLRSSFDGTSVRLFKEGGQPVRKSFWRDGIKTLWSWQFAQPTVNPRKKRTAARNCHDHKFDPITQKRFLPGWDRLL